MSDRPRLLECEWEKLVEDLDIETAAPAFLRELRRAFFSQALSYSSLVQSQLIPDRKPTEAEVAVLEALDAELVGFHADLVGRYR